MPIFREFQNPCHKEFEEPTRWSLLNVVPVRIIMPEDKEDLALTLQGKKSNLKRADFERFGTALQLSEIQIRKAVSHIVLTVSEALPTVLQASFLPQEMQEQIASLVQRQTQRL